MKFRFTHCRKLLRPAPAKSLVEVDQGEILIEHRVVDSDLRFEITTLGVKHVKVVEGSAAILQPGELHVFCGSVAQIGFHSMVFPVFLKCCDRGVDLSESIDYGFLVIIAALIINGD